MSKSENRHRFLIRSIGLLFVAGLLAVYGTAESSDLPAGPGNVGRVVRDSATGKIVPVPAPTPQKTDAPPKPGTSREYSAPRPAPLKNPSAIRSAVHICAPKNQESICTSLTLQQALDRAGPGGTVVLHPGTYEQAAYLRHDKVVIHALDGAQLVGATVGDKGALVVQGNDIVIEGLGCSGIKVADGNGACVRFEGTNLTLKQVHFHDSEQGLLTGANPGRVVIDESRFETLGKNGRAHGIYVGGGDLLVRRSLFLASRSEGHEIKSRAFRTVIEDSLIASLDGNDSYLIDIPNGGEAIIRRNILQEGPKSANDVLIAYGLEGVKHPKSSLTVENNIILLKRRNSVIVSTKNFFAHFVHNIVVGNPKLFSFGDVDSDCRHKRNICAKTFNGARVQTEIKLPRVFGIAEFLARSNLLN